MLSKGAIPFEKCLNYPIKLKEIIIDELVKVNKESNKG